MRENSTGLAEIHGICRIAAAAALMGAGAFMHISAGAVPFTLQDFFVVLCGLLLGPRAAFFAVALYLAAGAAGFPVFSGGRGGVGHFFGPTGGYLVGFLPLSVLSGMGGRVASRLSGAAALGAALAFCLLGLAVLYAAGALWLAYSMNFDLAKAFAVGVVPFAPVGAAKVCAALLVWRLLRRKKDTA